MICPRCGQQIETQRNLCTRCGLFVPKTESGPRRLAGEDFSVQEDLNGRKTIQTIPLLQSAIEWLESNWTIPEERAAMLGNGVRLSPQQLPQVYEILETGARRLELDKCPGLFIRQDPSYNAETLGTSNDAIIILHSSLLDNFQLDELSFVLSHELGHVKCGHVAYLTLGELIARGAHGLACIVTGVLHIANSIAETIYGPIRAWERQAEFSADRAGLIGSANLDASLRAMVMLALGSRKFLPAFSLPEYLSQSCDLEKFKDSFAYWAGSFDHPPTVQRTKALIEFASSDKGISIFNRMKAKGLLNDRKPAPKQLPLPAEACEPESGPTTLFCRKCGFELDRERRECLVCGELN